MDQSTLRIGGGVVIAGIGVVLAILGFPLKFSVVVMGIGAAIALNAPGIIKRILDWYFNSRSRDGDKGSGNKGGNDSDDAGTDDASDEGSDGSSGNGPSFPPQN